MLTVLVKGHGTEDVFEATLVQRIHDEEAPGVRVHRPDNDPLFIGEARSSDDECEVFVMNETGATVARYKL